MSELRYLPDGITAAEPLAPRTSFGVGGEARFYASVSEASRLSPILDWARRNQVPVYPLGGGTNVLVADDGVEVLVLNLEPSGEFGKVEFNEDQDEPKVRVGAAVRTAELVEEAAERGCGGLEFLADIPGTVGGAVATNAGGRAGKVEDVLAGFEGMPLAYASEDIFRLTRSKDAEEFLVLNAEFRVTESTPATVQEKIEGITEHRRRTQPRGVRSAGCIFKNPPRGGMSAGELIEQAGMKGSRRGEAVVSEKHANWIVNTGNATALDILSLALSVVERVRGDFGIQLAFEIDLWGESLEKYLIREGYLLV